MRPPSLPLVLSFEPGGESRQAALVRQLKAAILAGQLAPGDRLPASRALAATLGIARNTVLLAYQRLQAEGFIAGDRRGTRVAALPLADVRRPAPAPAPVAGMLASRACQLPRRSGDALLPFAPGVPDLNAFPWPAWRRQLQHAWGEVSARQLVHAPAGGEPALRAAIARFLRLRRGVDCSPEQVFVVAGGALALDACARLLADPGATAWLENPGYPAARSAFIAAGLKVVAVPVDRDGMAADAERWQVQPPRLIYLTPAHQYPLGAVLSLERRLDLLQRAAPGQCWIIEDDYDSEFDHARPGQRPLPALQGLVADAPVIYIGTFSKLLYPGLRVAYMVVPRWAVRHFGEALEALYRAGQAVEQRALARFFDSGRLLRHLRAMGPVYRRRQDALRAELERRFDASAILGGQAGLHLCLRLPAELPDKVVVERAAAHGVVARALSDYAIDAGDGAHNGLLLGYGMADEAHIPALFRQLATAF